MRIHQGRIKGNKITLHSMKDGKGHFTNGTCYFIDENEEKVSYKVGQSVGTEDVIMIMDLGFFDLLKLLFLSIFFDYYKLEK